MKKTFNLADKKEISELLKQLYGSDEVKDDQDIGDTERETRTDGLSEMAQLPPNCS